MPHGYELRLLGRFDGCYWVRQPMVKAKRLVLPPRGPLKLSSRIVTSICDGPQLAKRNGLHIQRKHSCFFINHIPGVCSAAESCVKIKHGFQMFFSLGPCCQFLVCPVELHTPSSVLLPSSGQRTLMEPIAAQGVLNRLAWGPHKGDKFLNGLEIGRKERISLAIFYVQTPGHPAGNCMFPFDLQLQPRNSSEKLSALLSNSKAKFPFPP